MNELLKQIQEHLNYMDRRSQAFCGHVKRVVSYWPSCRGMGLTQVDTISLEY